MTKVPIPAPLQCRMVRAAFVAAWLGLLASFGAPAVAAPSTPAERVDAVFARFERGEQPGCAVGVLEAGRAVLTRGYGLADLRRGTPITARSVFDIASASKQITAAMVYLLVADGVLSLSDDVRAWVPELAPYPESPTLDQLVHHVSGIPDYTVLLDAPDAATTTTADALAVLAEEPRLDFSPGKRFRYSNSNYFLLSLVAERATGRTFRELVDERIFGPLGMEHSLLRDDADEHIPRLAQGYAADRRGFERVVSNWQQTGDGAVHTNVGDLLRWVQNLSDFAVGGPELRTAMFTPGPRLDHGIGYGGGVSIDTVDGRLRVEHSGAWAGYLSNVVALPDDGLGVVVLCNRDDADPESLSRRVLRIWRSR